MKRYILENYGCQMNIAEGNALDLLLSGAGFEKTDDGRTADAVIINTCSVRKSAENRIWGRLSHYNHLKKTGSHLKLVVTGCMAERLKDELKKEAPFVDAVIGTNEKMDIVDFLCEDRLEREDGYHFMASYYKEGEKSSYVPIMNGCNNFCSYCIVPYVRGREVSRPVDDILNEVAFLESKGVREITLLGQNVNSYNYEGIRFPELLRRIASSLDSIEFVRFDSPHPKDFPDELMRVIAEEERVCSHIHLPMQAGSSRILSLMNRKTTREGFFSLVDRMRSSIPDLTFSTDVMVGFPTETEEEYEETLSAMDYLAPIEAFMYYYNLREGTPAARMEGQIPEEEKTRRLERLIDEQLKRAARIKEGRVGQSFRALVLSPTRDDRTAFLARNAHNETVSFHPKTKVAPGDIVTLRTLALKGNTYIGEQCDE